MAIHAVGVDEDGVGGIGKLVEGAIGKAAHHVAGLQRAVEEDQQVRMRAGIIRRDDEEAAGAAIHIRGAAVYVHSRPV